MSSTSQPLLQRGLELALHDLSAGRAELRRALAEFTAQGDACGRLIAAAALVQATLVGTYDDAAIIGTWNFSRP